jgi:RHS repeat-associated protein
MSKRIVNFLILALCITLTAGPNLSLAATANAKRVWPNLPRNPTSTPKAKRARVNARPQTATNPAGQSTTLLPDGRLLLIGGKEEDGLRGGAAIRDGRTGETVALPSGLHQARAWHSATMLPDGRVLVVGGIDGDGQALESAEIFDPEAQTFEMLSPASFSPHAYHTATLLTDGQVLIAGGISDKGYASSRAELWDFQTKTTIKLPSQLSAARQKHRASLLPDGNVLFEGGNDENGAELAATELYNTEARAFNFTTIRSDLNDGDAPFLAASLPHDGAKDVPVESSVALRFSKPLQVESINSQSVKLVSAEGTIAIKIVPAENGRLAFIKPRGSLLSGSTYTLTVSGATNGTNDLPATSITFTTKDKKDDNDRPEPPSFTSDPDWLPNADNLRGNWKGNFQKSFWQDLAPLQAAPGETALAGQVLTLVGQPLKDVTLRVGDKTVLTDNSGRFLLTSLSPGHQVLVIDGRTASKGGKVFGTFRAGVDITEKITNVLPFTIWMPRLDVRHAVTIPSPTTTDVVITNPLIPGLELHLPRGTVIRDIDGKAVTEVSITPVPTDRPPFPLPPGFNVPVFASIQPGGARIIPPRAKLIYPNYTNERPSARINFWNYDPEGKGWYIYGQGTVSANGRQIIPDPGVVIYEFTGIMISSGGSPPGTGPESGDDSDKDGEPVDLSTGLYVYNKTDLSLPDTLPITITRTYRPQDNASRAFGIGSTHPYEMFLWSINNYQETDLILPDGGRIHYVRISPGTGWGDAVYEHTATPGVFYKSRISWNGSGWDLKLKDGTVYVFPEFQPLQSIRDRYGNQLTITRSGGSITQITSPNGRWVQFTYDPSGRISQIKDNVGRTVNYAYDTGGRLWRVTDPKSGVTEYTYDPSNRMRTIKDARQIVYLTNEYDANGRVFRQTQSDTSTFQFAYTLDAGGKVTQTDVTDPRGKIRRMVFNSNGYTLSDTRGFGLSEQQTITYVRDPVSNKILSLTDAAGRKTTYSYDPLGNLASVTRLAETPAAATTTFTYEPTFSQITSISDPLNHTTTLGYDGRGSLTSVTDPLNHQTTLAYNLTGQPISVTDALQHSLQFFYSGGDLVEVRDSLGRSVTRFVDAAGRLLRVTNARGQTTKVEYDALNKITKITDPLAGVTLFDYDPNGNLLSVTDANNHVTTAVYDNMDRLQSRTDPIQGTTSTESYQYDLAGNIQKFTDRRGKVTSYEYDGLNRRIFAGFGTIGTPPTASYESTITYSYDAADRLTLAADSWSGPITRSYSEQARTISETTPQGTVSYAFDAAGRRTQMTVMGQQPVSYTFDDANRLLGLTQGTANVSFAYDDANRRTSLGLPNGTAMEYGYDNASQLTSITYKNGANVIGDLTYAYDRAGNRTKMGGSFARTGLPPPVTTATHDAANRLTQRGANLLTYDANGNLTSDGSNSYTWNSRNQLVSISGGTAATFQYDAFGRRINKAVGGTSTSFLYDGQNLIQEQSTQLGNANILGRGIDEIFTRSESSGTYNLFTDGLGSTLSLLDASGNVQSEYSYGAFGATASTGTASTNASQYTGRENDGTGLYYYRARYYSPALQRFISEDPIGFKGGDFNLYAYVGNNPINFVDPLGEDTLQVALSGSIIFGPGALVGSVGIAIDSSGNIGVYYEGGGGGAAGGKGSVGVSIHGSNAVDIYDLEGPFDNGSIGAGEGVAAAIDGFTGNSRHGRVIGGGVTIGGGAGVGGSVTHTGTVIPFSTNLGRQLCNFVKSVRDFGNDISRGICKLYGAC